MSSYVNKHESGILTGLFGRNFDTFSRPIVVWKQPIKNAIVASPFSGVQMFGFGTAPESDQYGYTQVSGVFPAVVRYMNPRHIGQAEVLDYTNSFIPLGEVKIQVRQDAYDFIESGTTDKFSFDNRDFYFVGKSQARPFLGSIYWEYQLKPKA